MVYEADDRVGRTILATGNGRCNFPTKTYVRACTATPISWGRRFSTSKFALVLK